MGRGKRAAIYLRVSTTGQSTENQRLELVKVAEQRGWIIKVDVMRQRRPCHRRRLSRLLRYLLLSR